MARSGIESGHSNNHLEFTAVVRGVVALTAIDATERPICVYTDSGYVLSVMQHACKRDQLPSRKTYRAVSELYSELCDVTGDRKLTASLRRFGDPHHGACDRAAKDGLRTYCCETRFARTMLLGRLQQRRKGCLAEVRKLEEALERIHGKLLECDIEIAALGGEVDA